MVPMNVSVLFNTPFLKRNEYFSIMKNINEKMEELERQFGNIEIAEIKLYDTIEDNTHNNKALLISIKLENESLVEYRVSGSWDNVITDAFNGLTVTGKGTTFNPTHKHLIY
jgi:hypothetical protein